jgi:hypothetical protein
MAALLLSFGLLMTGCDSDSSSSTTPNPKPPAATDMRTTYQGIGTVSATDDTTFVLVLSKPAVSRAYTAEANDEYTLYVGDTPAPGSSFDYSTAPSQSGTVTAKNTDVFTLTPTGGDATTAFKATVTDAGGLSKIERGDTAGVIVLSGDVSVDIPVAGFTLTKVEVPSLAGEVDFGEDPAYEVGLALTVRTTGITAPSSSPAFSYRWLSKQTGDEDFFDITGATGTTYTPQAADEGGLIRVIVTVTGYNGFAEATSETIGTFSGPALVTLATGSQGTAGDKEITGLTTGAKYLVKQGSNWYGVVAAGTLASSKTSPDAAKGDAVALDSGVTKITGLTNGTTYDVYIYGTVANGKEIGASVADDVVLGTGGKNAVADISALQDSTTATVVAGAGTGASPNGTTTVILLIDDVIIAGAVGTAATLANDQAPVSATLKYTTGTTTAGGATLQAKTGDKYITLAGVASNTTTVFTVTDRTVIGVVSIAETTEGAAQVAAVYTVTVDTALAADEKVTFADIRPATATYVYTPASSETTAAAQAAAIIAGITALSDELYTAAAGSAGVLTLTANTVGAISTDPTATVAILP